jgi:hypothetical protein
MRYIVTVIATLTLSTASYAQGPNAFISGLGYESCGKYLAAVHGHAPGTGRLLTGPGGQFYDDHTRYMDWLNGFFTATNMWVTHEPNGIKSDAAAIDVWIRKWCEQNPTKSLGEAAVAFVWDQRKDYLEAWFARQQTR